MPSNFFKILESNSNRFAEMLGQTFKSGLHNKGETLGFGIPFRKHAIKFLQNLTIDFENRFTEMLGQTFSNGSSKQGE